MDEPLSNLDAKLRGQMRIEIRRLHQRLGTTTIYVTHDQIEAMTMGDRIVILRDGVVQQIDTPEQVSRRPRNMFVAGFIGSPPMNFFEGRLVRNGDALYFENDLLRLRCPTETAALVRDRAGVPVILGIRPGNVHPASWNNGHTSENLVTARLEAVDLIGDETQLYLTASDTTFLAVFPSDIWPTIGSEVSVAFDSNRIHLFDVQTQESII